MATIIHDPRDIPERDPNAPPIPGLKPPITEETLRSFAGFAQPEEVDQFLDLIREIRKQDKFRSG